MRIIREVNCKCDNGLARVPISDSLSCMLKSYALMKNSPAFKQQHFQSDKYTF